MSPQGNEERQITHSLLESLFQMEEIDWKPAAVVTGRREKEIVEGCGMGGGVMLVVECVFPEFLTLPSYFFFEGRGEKMKR